MWSHIEGHKGKLKCNFLLEGATLKSGTVEPRNAGTAENHPKS